MAATTTKIGIINRALQHLGVASISSLTENSRGAKAMAKAYDSVLLAELRKNIWRFAVKRAQLAASGSQPIFGKTNYFPLPGDFVRLAPEEANFHDPRSRDWEIEGSNIVSSDGAPIDVRYVSSSIQESQFDVLFAEGFAAALARACCEEITNSNTKLQAIAAVYDDAIKAARKTNSIESRPLRPPTCSWITVRS